MAKKVRVIVKVTWTATVRPITPKKRYRYVSDHKSEYLLHRVPVGRMATWVCVTLHSIQGCNEAPRPQPV